MREFHFVLKKDFSEMRELHLAAKKDFSHFYIDILPGKNHLLANARSSC